MKRVNKSQEDKESSRTRKELVLEIGAFFILGVILFFRIKGQFVTYSDNILFSINNGAPSFGTEIDCMDAIITVFRDQRVEVSMNDEQHLTIAQFYLDDKDYKKIKWIASPRKIARLKMGLDIGACDSSSSYITLYDENDEITKVVGGYAVFGLRFNLIYDKIHEILEPYGIKEKIKAYKQEYRSMLAEVGTYNFSSNILFSTNQGAAGFGTEADCTDATIVVYTDKTVRVFMDVDDKPEVASFKLTEEDYRKLEMVASPQKISTLMVLDDWNVCDGNASDITVYDENDEILVTKGGYMVIGNEYHKIYNEIHQILEPYGIEKKVEEYRNIMREEYK